MQTRQGVIFTSGINMTSDFLLEDEKRKLRRFRVCAPHEPSIVLWGLGNRHLQMKHEIGLPQRDGRHVCLGSSGHAHSFLSEKHKTELIKLTESLPDNFVMITDPCAVRAFATRFPAKPISAYLIRINEGVHLSPLAENGEIFTQFPSRAA